MNLDILKAELIAGHPVTGAYSADDEIAAGQLNAVNIVRNRTSMTGREMAAEIVNAEYDALTEAKKGQILALIASDDIDPFGFAANVVKDVFTVISTTVTNLAAVRIETVSQAVDKSLGWVRPGNVAEARL